MPEVYTLQVDDEFSFEVEPVAVPPTMTAILEVEDLVLVQDSLAEFFVTRAGDRLTLWDPEVHWADHMRRRFQGGLAEAIAQARQWLASYLDIDPTEIDTMVEPDVFQITQDL